MNRDKTLLIAAGVIIVGTVFLVYQLSKNKQKQDNKETEKEKEKEKETEIEKEKEIENTDDDPSNFTNFEDLERMFEEEAKKDASDPQPYKYNTQEYTSDNHFPVNVFVRIRPLIKEEIESKHSEIEYSILTSKKTQTKILSIKNTNKKNKTQKFSGFKAILTNKDNNEITHNKCIIPSISEIFNGNTICTFAYGHTGSGKTHTMLGYGNENPGMYNLCSKHIFKQLSSLNYDTSDILLEIRFAELYQNKMRDLFGNLVECFVREDDNGEIHIRGQTIKDESTGKVKIQTLTKIHTKSPDKIIESVNNALKYRNVGSSTLHDESSRSHAFLEFELVNNNLITARLELMEHEADLVPVGKARDDELIRIQSSMFVQDENGQYKKNENYVEPDKTYLNNLQKQVKILENNVKMAKEKVNNIIKDGQKCLGGTIVFVDLAGNEYGQDAKLARSDPKQARERKEINKSLLCLKECIRGLHNKKKHIPYRDSKLTMVLRKHLKGDKSTAIMIANVSPSQEHVKKTVNTLSYSKLVANA